MELSSHPTVRIVQQRGERAPRAIDATELRALCLEAGAADVGLVGIDRQEVADQRAEVLAALPGARTLIAYVVRMNPSGIRAPGRSVASLEFHHSTIAAKRRRTSPSTSATTPSASSGDSAATPTSG